MAEFGHRGMHWFSNLGGLAERRPSEKPESPAKNCIPVYYPHGLEPLFKVSEEIANGWLAIGIATMVTRRGRSIRLRKMMPTPEVHGASATMNHKVMGKIIEGSYYHSSLALGWAPGA
jgi:hypothetical protein